ncbi:MAG: ubiquinone/menaquinone biosynthesis methyltransferase [Myxococcales bacterium]|nr:ubiquinone/menaquinone biosynthesis methyltransferase [Myxococcales bacterium]
MFDRIAAHYDQLNRVISLGLDRRWRRALCRAVLEVSARPVQRVLDLATGTGDVALALREEGVGQVVGVDPSVKMLRVAAGKHALPLVCGVGEQLPLASDSVDASVIAFGIRNVRDRARTLSELRRVTRPGGAVAVLELSQPAGGGLVARAARLHMTRVVPLLGRAISRGAAYAYLPQSIARFPAPEEFAAAMGEAGLQAVQVRPLTFGAASLFVARSP